MKFIDHIFMVSTRCCQLIFHFVIINLKCPQFQFKLIDTEFGSVEIGLELLHLFFSFLVYFRESNHLTLVRLEL